MGRPATRTAVVDGEMLELLREVFGASPNAWRRLGLDGLVHLATFRRAWRGETVAPVVVDAIRAGWDAFVAKLVRRTGTNTV